MSKESKFTLFVTLMLALTVMVDVHADTTPPYFNPGASSYYHDKAEGNPVVHYARLELVFDEEIDTTPANINAQNIILARDQFDYDSFIQLTDGEIKVKNHSNVVEFNLTAEHQEVITRWGAPWGFGDNTTTLWIQLGHGAVKDRAGNPNYHMSRRVELGIWRKDTDAGDADAPAGYVSSTYNANTKVFTVTFHKWMDTKPTSNVTASKFKVRDKNKAYEKMLSGSVIANDKTKTITITLTKQSHYDLNTLAPPLYLYIDTGAAHAISGEGCATTSAKPIAFTVDTTAPAYEGAMYDGNTLTITFDEYLNKPATLTITQADAFASKFRLFENSPDDWEAFVLAGNEIQIFRPGDIVGDTGGPDQFKFFLSDIHKSIIAGWLELYLQIDAGALADGKGNHVAQIGAIKIASFPDSPPEIRMASPISSATEGLDLTITAAVTDAKTQIASVRLSYQVGGALRASIFMATSYGSTYTATIPAPAVTNRGLCYYIWAEDDRGNTTTTMYKFHEGNWVWCADRNNPQNVTVSATVTLPADSLPTFDPLAMIATYRMLSVPISATDKTSIALFEGADKFGIVTEGDWFAWQFTGTGEFGGYQPGHKEWYDPITFDPGVAAWVGTFLPNNALTVLGTTPNVVAKYEIPLRQGWNQIGVPFNFSRNWDERTIDLDEGRISDTIYWFSGEYSGYSFASLNVNVPNQTVFALSWIGSGIPSNNLTWQSWPGSLDPWGGYWVYAYEDAILRIDPRTPAKGVMPVVPSAPSSPLNSWVVKLMAESGGVSDSAKFAGIVSDAQDGVDKYDVTEPPTFSTQTVRLSFVNEACDYLQDMKVPADEMFWQFKVNSLNDMPVTIRFDSSAVPEAYRTVLLIDTKTERRLDLRKATSYAYKPSGKVRNFKLVISKAALEVYAAIPRKSELLQNYPNPFNPETWIPFKLAEDGEVTVRIYNIAGQLVRTLELGHQEAGSYTVKERTAYWDGRNYSGEGVASGVYLYRISAGTFHATRKMVIMR